MKNFFLFLISGSLLFSQQPTHIADQSARPSEEWVKKGVIYEIYTRAFSKEGNFSGIEKKLPELKQLGVTILWLMPIHPLGEEKRKGSLGSPYSVRDYYGINPEFGNLNDFKRLVKKSHELGFKIIIDLVANHTSWDSKMFTEHPEWFTKDSTGKFVPPVADWSDVVDLNYNNTDLRRYIIEMLKYWVRDIGLDGFRCDVAEMVPTDFWNEARAALDSIRPVIMLSEGQYPEHHLKAFDLTYSWNMYGVMARVLKGEKPVSEFDSVLAREASAYPKGSIRMRFSSNHDENAWDKPDVEKFGMDGAKLAAVLVNTFPGVPLLYNGQEAANDVKLGLFEKFEIDWTKGKEFRELYKTLFEMRKHNPSLAAGEYRRVQNSSADKVYTFIRTIGENTIFSALNFSGDERTVHIELPKNISAAKFTDACTGKPEALKNVETITLPKFGYRIFIVK
ncbi:MAG: alpha-amylase family glycosyl hydrolase [Bacteroidota bacterium]